MKVFLGGTCNESTWRQELILLLEIGYFDPVVEDWDEKAYQNELRERKECDFCLYVLTPKMTGFYSIAEVVDDSNKRPERTVFCVLEEDNDMVFDVGQLKSLEAIKKMVKVNGGKVFLNLTDVADYLNEKEDSIPNRKERC